MKYQKGETERKIRQILNEEFAPLSLEIEDQSHFHAGHRSAGGGGHFFVTIRSEAFNGLMPLARQRLVFEKLEELMKEEVHALSMKCLPK